MHPAGHSPLPSCHLLPHSRISSAFYFPCNRKQHEDKREQGRSLKHRFVRILNWTLLWIWLQYNFINQKNFRKTHALPMCPNADIEIESTRRRKQKTSNQPSCLGKKYLPAANADGGWERIFVKICIHDKLNLE